jgi:hypothetical protein
VAKLLEVSHATLSRWQAQYGGMRVDDAKELCRLRDENGRLKRMVADLKVLSMCDELTRESVAGDHRNSPGRRSCPGGLGGV